MKELLNPWCWRMAWRDSRAQRGRLLLFLSSIFVGITAVVALQSFSSSVKEGVNQQSQALLGADLMLRSRRPLPPQLIEELQVNSAENCREWRFASMAVFPESDGQSRLVQVRGVESGFPIYGRIESYPAEATALFQTSTASPAALVDEILAAQFNLQPGDPVKVGKQTFKIAGFIKSLPGESLAISELAPRVLIPFSQIEPTGLIGFGSRVSYRHYFRYRADISDEDLLPRLKQAEITHALRYETVSQRQLTIDRTLSNLFHFLNLVAFTALILGGIGIGSAVRVHINSKLANAAVLRCLGCSRAQAFAIYFIQVFCMGLGGGLAGAAAGSLIQYFLPALLGPLLPLQIESSFSGTAFFSGVAAGVLITLLFSMPPLLRLNGLSAAAGLRGKLGLESVKVPQIHLIRLSLGGLIVAFSILSAADLKIGLLMAGGLCSALLLLTFLAWLMIQLMRRFLPFLLPFCWRQGLRNLYRPGNQTLTLVCAMGTGCFLICLLFLTRENMLYQLERSGGANKANIVLFDIQSDQIEELQKLLVEQNLPAGEAIPIVDMQLKGINGVGTGELLKANRGKEGGIPAWTLRRTYRCSYREAELNPGESLLEGELHNRVDLEKLLAAGGRIPVSVESGLMEKMQLSLGDQLDFNLGGFDLPCVIASSRKVEWMQMRPNFFVLFPPGVLEDAPQMIVSVTHCPDAASSAALQKAVSSRYPNISVLDLSLVVNSVGRMLERASEAIKVMALFCILTGLIILVNSLCLSQLQRLRDNALLKVLGAERRQIRHILAAEFTLLALLCGSAGSLLAYAASTAIGILLFENPMPLNPSLFLWSNLTLLCISLTSAFLLCGRSYSRSSLQVLRQEM
jgi:putative ABC transport system permease protein